MIFLVLFGIIALVVISLNIYDSSNLKKIENYFKANKCKQIVYSAGIYKGICKDEVLQVANSFIVDLEKNKSSIKLNQINKINENGLTLIINDSYKIVFKEKEKLEAFQKSLEDKKNK